MFVALDTPILAGTSQGYGKRMGKTCAQKNERTDQSEIFASEREKAALKTEAAEAAVAGKLRQEDA